MRGSTHSAAGLAVGIYISSINVLPAAEACVLTGVSVIASLIPDIDVCTSKLGRRLAPASFLIQLLFGHRTIFHSPVFYAVILCTLQYCYPQYGLYFTAIAVSIASHLLLDMLNAKGIPLLWPLKKRFHLATFPTGGIVDRLLGLGLSLITIANAIQYITK